MYSLFSFSSMSLNSVCKKEIYSLLIHYGQDRLEELVASELKDNYVGTAEFCIDVGVRVDDLIRHTVEQYPVGNDRDSRHFISVHQRVIKKSFGASSP